MIWYIVVNRTIARSYSVFMLCDEDENFYAFKSCILFSTRIPDMHILYKTTFSRSVRFIRASYFPQQLHWGNEDTIQG